MMFGQHESLDGFNEKHVGQPPYLSMFLRIQTPWVRRFSMIFPSISPWFPCDMPHVLPIEFPSQKPRLNPHRPQEHVVALQLANDQCHARARAEGEHGIGKEEKGNAIPKRDGKRNPMNGNFGSIT